MARVEKTIDVNVPVSTAYNQWTQFEEFPRFMDGVNEVRQLDNRRLHWRASVGGREKEWDAVIREQEPDTRIIWQNTSGAENAGIVMFESVGPACTRVHLEMSYDPEGFVENTGDALGFLSRRVEGDLQRFKELIEDRGAESGGWRGEIHNETVPGGHTRGMPEGARDKGMSGSVPGSSGALRSDARDMGDAGTPAVGSTGTPGGMTGSSSARRGGMGGEFPERSGPAEAPGGYGIGGERSEGGMGGEFPERG